MGPHFYFFLLGVIEEIKTRFGVWKASFMENLLSGDIQYAETSEYKFEIEFWSKMDIK